MKVTAIRPKITVSADGKGIVSQAGALLLTQSMRATGLDRGLTAALERWRSPRAVHDPGKIIADLVVMLALGGDCLADISVLLAQPTLGYAAAPFNSLAAQRAALAAWLRERRRNEFRRDRRMAAAGTATGGLVAVFGAVVVAAALLFAPSHHPVRPPSLTGPGHSGRPAHGNGGPSGKPSRAPAHPSRRPSPPQATPSSAPPSQPATPAPSSPPDRTTSQAARPLI